MSFTLFDLLPLDIQNEILKLTENKDILNTSLVSTYFNDNVFYAISKICHVRFPKMRDIHLIKLARYKTLTSLYLNDDCINEKLADLTRLTSNDVTVIEAITDEAIIKVAESKTLTILSLRRNSIITDISLKKLAEYKTLTHLDLSYNKNITDNSLEKLAESKTLTSLDLRYNNNITDKAIEFLAHSKNT